MRTGADTISDDDFLFALGLRIGLFRRARRMDVHELAKQCGISRNSMYQIEKGLSNISIIRVKRIADALDIPLDLLLEDLQAMPRQEPTS